MAHLRPLLALLVLALITFWPLVLHPTETLYSDSSDLLAEHLPAKMFLVRSLRETGELPLWNPEQYAGSPFVHDIQVGLFYPPNLPLYFISEPAVGPFLSWLVFVHVLLAGWLMYAYARHAGLGELAAFTAGVGFMLSPRWMMQLFLAGHTVTQGICWTPLVILCVERSIQRRSLRWAIGGGVAYALFVLGTHPQWTFYGSLLIGLWPLRLASRERERPVKVESPASLKEDYGEPGCVSSGSTPNNSEQLPQPELPVLTQPGSPLIVDNALRWRTLLSRWLLAEAIIVLIGLGLCAVQLLPTIEAAGESSRAHGMGQSWSLDGAKAAATTLIGPIPDKKAEPIHWETRGGIGFTWAIMAIVGARLGGRRAFVPIAITLGMLAYALGGSYVIDRLPGFNNFRMPTRMLLTMAFPVAYLAGLGMQSLMRQWCQHSLRVATVIAIILVASPGTIAILADGGIQWNRLSRAWWLYWLTAPNAWLVSAIPYGRWSGAANLRFAAALLIVDILSFSLPYPNTKPIEEVFPHSAIIEYIRENNPDGHRVFDVGPIHIWMMLSPGNPVASVHGIPTALGYNPLDVARYRRYLAFVAGIGEQQEAFGAVFTHPVVAGIAVQNDTISLFDLIGHRYLLVQRLYGKGSPIIPHLSPLYIGGQEEPRFVRQVEEGYRSYDFLAQGIHSVPTQYLLEHPSPFPRAFVLPSARAQASEPGILDQLKAIDLRTAATLEDWNPARDPLPPGNPGPARIRSHSPNRIAIDLDGQTAGLLVLTDPWYPGWVCRIDGQETKIWKADYAFRGVIVPPFSREVVFHFEPHSYRRGRWISLVTLAGVAVFFAVGVIRRRRL